MAGVRLDEQPQEASPLLAVRVALPLVAQVVLVLLHARRHAHDSLDPGEAGAERRHPRQPQTAAPPRPCQGAAQHDRKRSVTGKRGSVRVEPGWPRLLTKQIKETLQ